MSPPFSTALKDHRARLGLSQPEFAKFLGYSARTAWAWEHGESAPRPLIQETILKKLRKAKAKPKDKPKDEPST